MNPCNVYNAFTMGWILQNYHWGLNEAGGRGADYSPGPFKRLF